MPCDPPSELTKAAGRFLGVYHAYPNAGYEDGPAVIGLYWSRDLLHWTIDPPCLRPEDGAAWENGGIYKPCLVRDRGTYYLFYNAKTKPLPRSEGGGWRELIGVATSTDLKTWTRYPANPILPVGPAGAPDDRFASDPCVLTDAHRWVFFYYRLDKKGKARELMAVGDDPFSPGKGPRNPDRCRPTRLCRRNLRPQTLRHLA
jgi:sucrose-6-phosphate hydrolase SacC (GH32 family)